MNKRILQLAKQAGFDAELMEQNHNNGNPSIAEKFAELIIKDCAKMCDELKADYFVSRRSTHDFDEKNIFAEGESACDTLKHRMKRLTKE